MELWDVLDQKGNPKGRTIVRGQPLQPGDYHLAVHAWIVDSNGRYLIQRRADHLKLHPGIWATTGGSALAGEDSETAVIRELQEELGITAGKGEMSRLAQIIRSDNLVDLWLLRRDIGLNQLKLQKEEVSTAKFVTGGQLREMIDSGQFYDYGADYLDIVTRGMGDRAPSPSK